MRVWRCAQTSAHLTLLHSVAYVVWSGQSASIDVHLATENMTVGDGKILKQTFAVQIDPDQSLDLEQQRARKEAPGDGRDRKEEKEDGARTPQGAKPRAGSENSPEGEAQAQGKGADMSEPDFYANATLGFRQWYFSVADGGEPSPLRGYANPLLHGLLKYGFNSPRYRWHVDEPNYAECARLAHAPDSLRKSHGEVPGIECSCGFYAYGRRVGSNSSTTIHFVGGAIAGWGTMKLHERGFKCGAAKILALFEPHPEKELADSDRTGWKTREALRGVCAENAISLLEPDALRDDDGVRHYAREHGLALLEDQIKDAP